MRVNEVQVILENARKSTNSGTKINGSMIRLVYKRCGKVTESAKHESKPAMEAGAKMDEYVGTLDKVAKNKDGELYFVIHVMNRVAENPNSHQPQFGNYRTFNAVQGKVVELEVLS